MSITYHRRTNTLRIDFEPQVIAYIATLWMMTVM